LANIAGIIDSFEAADTVSDKTFDRVIAVNLTAPTRMIRAVLPIMKAKQHGCIINCGSKAGMSGASAGVAYTAVRKIRAPKTAQVFLVFLVIL
jgi:NAD(P)-dependent dehydrogenase (short-subunit alcohol dehydrogenase family)